MGRKMDRPRRDLGLVDLADRPGLLAHVRARPIELGGVERGKLDHAHPDLAVLMVELGPNRIEEALDGVLGAAIGRLERDAAIGRSEEHTSELQSLMRNSYA